MENQASPFTFGTGSPGGINLFKATEPLKLIDSTKGTTVSAADTTSTLTIGGGDDDHDGDTSGHPEEYEPQLDYKPIVKLNEVEVKTGEEDEDVLLKLRCKLFRLDQEAKEWKEKGTGDIKILRHKKNDTIRVLMRRDQVLKLCANHKIAPDMKLTEINPKQFTWMAVDFSEEQAKSELLLARFKDADEASKFKAEFEKAVKLAHIKSPQKGAHVPASNAPAPVNSLSAQFKTDGWKCPTCYAPNKKEILKCACCQTPKPGAELSYAFLLFCF